MLINSNDKMKKLSEGFTLIELLVVIAIIAILATIIIMRISSALKDARDSRRLADMDQIQKALEMYLNKNGYYPGNTDNDCTGWDVGYNGSGDPFIQTLETSGFIAKVPGDPTNTSSCGGYRYYRYTAGSYNCPASRGAFYVLEIINMETSGNPHPSSKGWSCPLRNWQTEGDWVVGNFER